MGGYYVKMMSGICQLMDLDGLADAVQAHSSTPTEARISQSVGINSPNLYDDVRAIQYHLNQVPPVDGGPNPQLQINGDCTPATLEAIRKFQLKYFGQPGVTGKIEPGKETLAKLNEISGKYDVHPKLPMDPTMNSWLLEPIFRHLDTVRKMILSAQTNLLKAGTVLEDKKNLQREEYMRMANRYFDIDKFPNPRQMLEQVKGIFDTMDMVFKKPGDLWGKNIFALDPLPSSRMQHAGAVAYAGNFYNQGQVSPNGFRRDAIYITLRGASLYLPRAKAGPFTLIHELAHYVSAPKGDKHVGDYAYLHQPEKVKLLTPNQKVCNADNYSCFAYHVHTGVNFYEDGSGGLL